MFVSLALATVGWEGGDVSSSCRCPKLSALIRRGQDPGQGLKWGAAGLRLAQRGEAGAPLALPGSGAPTLQHEAGMPPAAGRLSSLCFPLDHVFPEKKKDRACRSRPREV